MAGNGELFYGGDGGGATSAQLGRELVGIAVDDAGNTYFADREHQRVRKVDPGGVVTKVAGNAPLGTQQGGYSGDGGPATEALLKSPNGVAVDGTGPLYIADSGNCRVRKVSDGVITTVAGTGGVTRPLGQAPGFWATPTASTAGTGDRRPWPSSGLRGSWPSTEPTTSM